MQYTFRRGRRSAAATAVTVAAIEINANTLLSRLIGLELSAKPIAINRVPVSPSQKQVKKRSRL